MKTPHHLSLKAISNSNLIKINCKSKNAQTNIDLSSVSIFTKLKAPLASPDQETLSLVDFKEENKKSNQNLNEKHSFKLNSLDVDNILEEVLTKSSLNSSCCMSIHINHKSFERLNEESSFIKMNKNCEKIKNKARDNYCFKMVCFCCYSSLKSSRFFKAIDQKRNALKRFVDGKFKLAIICAILINTLSMSIEHHNQVNKFFMIVNFFIINQ